MAGNRSANTYQKIDTVFKRDANNIIMQYDELVDPSLIYMRKYGVKFDATEKIDGTNMRIEVLKHTPMKKKAVRWEVTIKGKSDDAQIPPHLDKFMHEKFTDDVVLNALSLENVTEYNDPEKYEEMFNKANLYIIYGEGYGAKIQKGGNYIPDGVGFIVFDVKVDGLYLLRPNMVEIAEKLGAPSVPYIGEFTIDEAIEYARKGFKSTIAANKDYNAEGLVLTTPVGLRDRRGERVIFKIKTRDFVKYRARYGTDGPVEQPINTKYER